jgi:hypothetical protein
MAWSSLTPTQIATEIDLSQSGIPLKAGQSHGSTTLCMTKVALSTKYDVELTLLAAYASNQLVQKQHIQAAAPTGFTLSVTMELSGAATGSLFRLYTNEGVVQQTLSVPGSVNFSVNNVTSFYVVIANSATEFKEVLIQDSTTFEVLYNVTQEYNTGSITSATQVLTANRSVFIDGWAGYSPR